MAEVDTARELRDIKMLLILQLLNDGVKQRQIAAAIGVSEATMSRTLPKGLSASMRGKDQKGAD
jgi:DNA-binding transcriptional regulator LsrR (DeoR family)